MTDQDKLIYGLIFSVIGISIGWLLNQLSQWVKSKNADKRNLKRVLFILLETNFLIGRSDFNQFKKIIFNVLKEIAPNPKDDEETHLFITNLIETTIVTLLKDELFEKFKNAKYRYLDAIDKLSEIDPIHAYYLHGNTNAVDILEKFEPIILNIGSDDLTDYESRIKAIKLISEKLKPEFFKETLDRLQDDIFEVSKKISWFTYLKSKKSIELAKFNTQKNLEEVVSKWKEVFGEEIKKFQRENYS